MVRLLCRCCRTLPRGRWRVRLIVGNRDLVSGGRGAVVDKRVSGNIVAISPSYRCIMHEADCRTPSASTIANALHDHSLGPAEAHTIYFLW